MIDFDGRLSLQAKKHFESKTLANPCDTYLNRYNIATSSCYWRGQPRQIKWAACWSGGRSLIFAIVFGDNAGDLAVAARVGKALPPIVSRRIHLDVEVLTGRMLVTQPRWRQRYGAHFSSDRCAGYCIVGAICFWAIDKFANDRRLANLLKLLVVLICLGAILQRVLPLAY